MSPDPPSVHVLMLTPPLTRLLWWQKSFFVSEKGLMTRYVCYCQPLQAKALATEVYRWIGAAVKPSLEKSLKPVQVSELHTHLQF